MSMKINNANKIEYDSYYIDFIIFPKRWVNKLNYFYDRSLIK